MYTDFDAAAACIRKSGAASCFVMGAKGKVADRLSREGLPFRALEFVRSDRGVWAHKENAASLPLGCLSSASWIRRLKSITIFRSVDASSPWIWQGRAMTNSVLGGFDVIAEIVSGGFVAREYDCDIQTLEPPGETVDLGEINADVLNLPRVEIVMGTDVDDARRVRLMSGVHNISQRKVGDHGRVRVTLDVPVGMLDAVTSRSRLWARSRIRAQTGVLLHQSKQQWQELAAVLNAESWVAGRIICESPRWVLISAAEELSTDDVVGRLMELRISGAITQDISYRAWSGSAASGTCVTTGTIDTGAIAEVKNADPRLTTGACHALLAAVGIWVRCDSISLTEAYDSQGNASRTLRVSISRSEIDRLVGVPRRFIWEGQQLKVPFSKAADAMDHRTPKHANADATNANATEGRYPQQSVLTPQALHLSARPSPKLMRLRRRISLRFRRKVATSQMRLTIRWRIQVGTTLQRRSLVLETLLGRQSSLRMEALETRRLFVWLSGTSLAGELCARTCRAQESDTVVAIAQDGSWSSRFGSPASGRNGLASASTATQLSRKRFCVKTNGMPRISRQCWSMQSRDLRSRARHGIALPRRGSVVRSRKLVCWRKTPGRVELNGHADTQQAIFKTVCSMRSRTTTVS